MKRMEYYARRVYNLAITDPYVDIMDSGEVEDFVRSKAQELCLPEDRLVDEVLTIVPKGVHFKRASELHGVDLETSWA